MKAEKYLSGENVFGNKKFVDIFLFFICQTSYCSNLRENKQIPLFYYYSFQKGHITKDDSRGHEKFDNSVYFKVLVIV